MTRQTLSLTHQVQHYLATVTLQEPEVLTELREETTPLPDAHLQIAPEQGQFMRLLVQLVGARRAIEVGVYTGYSSICIALELPRDGLLVACDVDAEITAMAARYWRQAGVADRVQLRIGRAQDTLRQLLSTGGGGTFDFAFIDADKASSDVYYESCLELLRPGGVIAVDNALWQGRVADPEIDDIDTKSIRDLNAKVSYDPRVLSSLVPIGDGLLLARKLAP